jgi:hypothetical protein
MICLISKNPQKVFKYLLASFAGSREKIFIIYLTKTNQQWVTPFFITYDDLNLTALMIIFSFNESKNKKKA